jgi:hypothetical protein
VKLLGFVFYFTIFCRASQQGQGLAFPLEFSPLQKLPTVSFAQFCGREIAPACLHEENARRTFHGPPGTDFYSPEWSEPVRLLAIRHFRRGMLWRRNPTDSSAGGTCRGMDLSVAVAQSATVKDGSSDSCHCI